MIHTDVFPDRELLQGSPNDSPPLDVASCRSGSRVKNAIVRGGPLRRGVSRALKTVDNIEEHDSLTYDRLRIGVG